MAGDFTKGGLQKGCYGFPVRVLIGNLLTQGFTFVRNKDGKFVLRDPEDYELTEPYKREILKRRGLLEEFFIPAPSEKLLPYFGRLLNENEIATCYHIAANEGGWVSYTYIYGRYLLECLDREKAEKFGLLGLPTILETVTKAPPSVGAMPVSKSVGLTVAVGA